jgi:hypothetical protein
MEVIKISKEKSFSLSKNFINSLSKVKGKEDYRKIDAQLEKMSSKAMADLFKMHK